MRERHGSSSPQTMDVTETQGLVLARGIGKTLAPQLMRLKMPSQAAMTKPIGVDVDPLARHFADRLLENAQCDGVQNYTARQPRP